MEFFYPLIGQAVQTFAILIGGFIALGALKTEVRFQGDRLESIEGDIDELRKAVISLARNEERVVSLDQRMTLQGQRLDRTIQKVDGFLIYGRRAKTIAIPEEETE